MASVLGQVLTAIVTPFNADGSVNIEGFKRLAAHIVDGGTDGLVVAGTTGESPTLSDGERLELFAAAVDAVGDRASIVAGTGTYSTSHSVHLTEAADALGVDAFLVVTPYYNKPPERGIVAHFEAIAEVTEKPIVAYNIPQRVVVNIEPETFKELARIPNVQYVKQATTDLDQARRIVEDTGLTLLAGNDDLLMPFLELGGRGGVFVYTNLVAQRVKELVTRFEDGDIDGAREIEAELKPIIEALAVTTNPIPVKAALNMLGHDVGGLRLPLVEATEEEKAVVRGALERAGVLAVAQA
jgi:4-hydroxy-tetrahydrodipicolinate synthase